MVATNEGDSFRIADFQSKQKQKCFNRIKATIYKVA